MSRYDKLPSRTVDLVGDYAGDELFIIDGDSLLLHVFSDSKLDFSPGFQILHAIYLIETFLHKLQRRRCVFHIAFSAENANLCIPIGVEPQRRYRYLLTREIVIRHLKEHASAEEFAVPVHELKSYESDEFFQYLRRVGAYFFMCHDGAFPKHLLEQGQLDSDDTDSSMSDEESMEGNEMSQKNVTVDASMTQAFQCRTGLRKMIYRLMMHGYNVALINELEFRDTKIMSMIVERPSSNSQSRHKPIETRNTREEDSDSSDSFAVRSEDDGSLESLFDDYQNPAWPIPEKTLCDSANPRGVDLILNALRAMTMDFTQREYLTVTTIIVMMESGVISKTEMGAARALLLHTVLLRDCQLSDRAIAHTAGSEEQRMLNEFARVGHKILSSNTWQNVMEPGHAKFDLYDLLDGRLFSLLASNMDCRPPTDIVSSFSWSKFEQLCTTLKELFDFSVEISDLISDKRPHKSQKHATKKSKPNQKFWRNQGQQKVSEAEHLVLPFENPVFDSHLQPVHLSIDDTVEDVGASEPSKTFKELSHWHNAKRPLDTKSGNNFDPWQTRFIMRRNAIFMAEMRDYAASLTNATGAILEPETVFVKSAKDDKRKAKFVAGSNKNSTSSAHLPKKKSHTAAKPAVRDQAAKLMMAKQAEVRDKVIKKWIFIRKGLDKELDLVNRYVKVKEYFTSKQVDKSDAVGAEILTYQLDTLVRLLRDSAKSNRQQSIPTIMSFIWETIWQISKLQDTLTVDIVTYVTDVSKILGLPGVKLEAHSDQQLSFQCVPLTKKDLGAAKLSTSPIEFQLLHAGLFMDRNVDSAPDSRVHDFEPDRWQREVLDQIDAKTSVFVVAPTSSGKTFISFYAMKQILEEDDDGILVYVAPTKALVNQIAAEVQARFSKSYRFDGKSVWAIHTRDYRINNPAGCQVLITVPHILQIMLLAPSNAQSWSSRVKRIIFDEVHCIGQAEDGVVWEQLLLMAPCPIIALSATVGNPQEFYEWLAMTQKATGTDLKMIEHRQRYSDLRKYVYHPPTRFAFGGFSEPPKLSPLGLDETSYMRFVHPVSSLFDRSRGMPEDLSFEPRDCLTLWEAMKKHECPGYLVDPSVDPNICLPALVRKVDVVRWESQLKALLRSWMSDHASPFDKVMEELSRSTVHTRRPDLFSSVKGRSEHTSVRSVNTGNVLETTLPLICTLHGQNALPALFFNYDRSMCERICKNLLEHFTSAEKKWKDTDPTWKRKIEKWDEWKIERAKTSKKGLPKASKNVSGRDEMSRAERERETASTEVSQFESFDPDAPVDGFHIADIKKLSPSIFQQYADQLGHRGVPQWLISALQRGIGVHHAGMNRKYRQVCEILFRKGYLRVVIATGTLALGINMPCKTVVFSGDSVFLTALNYRQASGRAGRRGFDVLGNVVFQNISDTKVYRLMSSRLPHLNGHFPITTSLVLRLCNLLHESKNAPFAVRAINSILTSPRIYLGGAEMRHTVLHHLRFSLEYLRRNDLLSRHGAPLNFAGCVGHLYYTENSSFAFHALLNSGFFHKLCRPLSSSSDKTATLRSLILVLSHLFGRQPIRQANLENIKAKTQKSTSVVVLPPMPSRAVKILKKHNQETLRIYTAYVATFIEQHVTEPDRTLPLTKIECGGETAMAKLSSFLSEFKAEVRIASPFYALSGQGDECRHISDLCQIARSGVWLEEAVVPYVGVHPEEVAPLNAYLYDFFKHGNVTALIHENGIRRGDLWFLLNDFSLVLATIVTSLENFLKLTPDTDLDMLDVMGQGEAYELELDDEGIEFDEKMTVPNQAARAQSPKTIMASPAPAARTKSKSSLVAENWDDDLSDAPNEVDEEPEAPSPWKTRAARREGKKLPKATVQKSSAASDSEDGRILLVLKAFKMLQSEFNEKFRAFWA
ncbi:hypothetical protein PDE_05592 [Penicillium oxalicum 114-2]|uniref:DEAD/DEAH box helicase n=1 Tax=Penicillium oxalicum (strain 114-2 / CGMCC 5302) TaxID=933388 RepID=S7ZJ17_PENO1|nr:hypothetical protein PDE_05592 [Penicillium oxalicum 114-2]